MSQSSSTRDHALTLLSQNISPSQVAAACGVSESAISQLLSDEDFAAALADRTQAATAQDLAYDSRLDEAESLYLANIEKRAPFANLQQSLQAFRILNQARRRKDSRIQAPQGGGVAVTINVPVSILPQYVKNANAEIIEVDGRTMLSATPSTVENLMKQRLEAAGRTLPSTQHVGLTKVERAKEGLKVVDALSRGDVGGEAGGDLPSASTAARPRKKREPINLIDLL